MKVNKQTQLAQTRDNWAKTTEKQGGGDIDLFGFTLYLIRFKPNDTMFIDSLYLCKFYYIHLIPLNRNK